MFALIAASSAARQRSILPSVDCHVRQSDETLLRKPAGFFLLSAVERAAEVMPDERPERFEAAPVHLHQRSIL